MKTALLGLLSSKKFWTLLLGLGTAIGAHVGLEVDTKIFWAIVGLTGMLIGAQGLQDHGKEKAKIEKQGGFASVRLMAIIATLGIVAAIPACGASARTKALQTQLVVLNTARDTFLAVSRTHEAQIIEQATTKEDGRTKLDAWRLTVAPIVTGFEVGYRAIAAAALLSDVKSVTEAVAAVSAALALAGGVK